MLDILMRMARMVNESFKEARNEKEQRIEGYLAEDGTFLITGFAGSRIEPLKGVPLSELPQVTNALATAGDYVRAPWSKVPERGKGFAMRDWNATAFGRVMSKATPSKLAFAKTLWKHGSMSNTEIAKQLSKELGYEHTWRSVNGIESAWTRTAHSWSRRYLFESDTSGKWGIVRKYKDLFDAYFGSQP